MPDISYDQDPFVAGVTKFNVATAEKIRVALDKLCHRTSRGPSEALNADTFGPLNEIPVPIETVPGPNNLSHLYADRNIAIKLSRRKAHEEATGGMQTILWDKNDNESIHYVIPKINIEDLFGSTNYGTGLFPAFYRNGVEKSLLFYPVYKAVNVGGLACSLPGKDPWTSINYDSAIAACTGKNRTGETGWHLSTMLESALVRLWCLRNGFQPRGNTNYGRAHDATHERALRVDNGIPGVTTGTPRTRNGTGPASWRHDSTPFGIADLVGNIWEWQGGMKLVDGQIYLPSSRDNYYDQADTAWTATGVYFDSTGTTGTDTAATQNGAPILSGARMVPSDDCGDGLGSAAPDYDYTYIGGDAGARSVTMSASYDALSIGTRQLMMQLLVAHKLTGASASVYSAKGAVWVRNYGERVPFVGGYWGSGADAGLAALILRYRRGDVSSIFGFRPAYLL